MFEAMADIIRCISLMQLPAWFGLVWIGLLCCIIVAHSLGLSLDYVLAFML